MSSRGAQIIFAPASSAPCEATNSPCTWKIGSMCSSTSSLRQPKYSCSVRAFDARLRCVSIAPLLRPVVPDVYRMAARSSSPRCAVSNVSGCAAARCNSDPVRFSSSVNTCAVLCANATLETQPKLLLLQTTTDGSALPTK